MGSHDPRWTDDQFATVEAFRADDWEVCGTNDHPDGSPVVLMRKKGTHRFRHVYPSGGWDYIAPPANLT